MLDAAPANIEKSLELSVLLSDQFQPSFLQPPELPTRISASKIVQLISDPDAFYDQLSRPMPQLFSESAASGSEFHASLEQAFLEGSELDFSSWSEEQKELGQNFAQSRFSELKPFAVELPMEFAIAKTVVVCKLDAVFETPEGYLIVDWKSGKSPSQKAIDDRSIQLALYRIGLARMLEVGVEKISAAFYFAGDNKEVMPNLASESEIEHVLSELRRAPLPKS